MGVNLSMDNIHEFNEEYNKIGKNLSKHLIKFDGDGKIHVEKKPSIFTRLFSPTFSKEGYIISNASDLTKNLQAMKQNLENYEKKNKCTGDDLNELKKFIKNVNNTLEYIKIHKTAGRSVEERKSIDALFDTITIKDNSSIESLIANKDWVQAEKELKQAIESNPKDFLAHGKLGDVYREQGKLTEAKTHLKKAIDLDPKYAFAHARLGDVYRQEKQFVKAQMNLRRAMSLDSKDSFARARFGSIYIEKGNPRKAAPYILRAVALDEQLKRESDAFTQARAGCIERLVRKNLNTARSYVERANELDPRDAFAWRERGLLFLEGILVAGEARDYLEKANELDPDNHFTYKALAEVYEREGDSVKAEEFATKAQQLKSAFEAKIRFQRA